MWGGALTFNYTPSVLDAQMNAFSSFMNPMNFDDRADVIAAVFSQNPGSVRSVLDVMFYVEPIINPLIFRPFTSIASPVSNTLRLGNISNIISEQLATLPADANRAASW
ncbi:FAD binding domain-containing protein [Seiridium cupressi]